MDLSEPKAIGPGIFAVAGPDMTDRRDALAYLIEDQGDLALIDAGAGPSYQQIVANIRRVGHDPSRLRFLIATHGHVDHIGGLADFVSNYSPTLVARAEEAPFIEKADLVYSAATWYRIKLKPVKVDLKLEGSENHLTFGRSDLVCVHSPGHTPGSMVVYLDRSGQRYLFAQDVHGPFDPSFNSDLAAWRRSMAVLLALEADFLAEGHYGVYEGRDKVAGFIQSFLNRYPGTSGR